MKYNATVIKAQKMWTLLQAAAIEGKQVRLSDLAHAIVGHNRYHGNHEAITLDLVYTYNEMQGYPHMESLTVDRFGNNNGFPKDEYDDALFEALNCREKAAGFKNADLDLWQWLFDNRKELYAIVGHPEFK